MQEMIKQFEIDQSTWTYKGFHGVLHTFFPVAQTCFAMKGIHGVSNSMILFFAVHDYIHWYWNDDELTRVRESFFKKLRHDKKYLSKLISSWEKKLAKFDKVTAKISKIDLNKLDNSQLADLYDQFFKTYLDEFKYFMTLGDAISMHADRYLIPEFEKILGSQFGKVFPKLITTKHLSFIEEEQADRNLLMKYLKQGKQIPEADLNKHSKKYFYIYNNYAKVQYLTPRDFARIINQDFANPVAYKPSKSREEILAEKNQLIKQWKITGWNSILLKIMDEFFGIQDTRKKYVLIANYFQFEFLRQAQKRSGIPFNLLTYSVFPEFRDVLAKKIKISELRARKKMCVFIQTPKSSEIVTGKEAKKMFDYFQGENKQTSKVSGIVASRGKARGVVKIILKVHDMANMDDGDIIVATMTRPEIAPAMRKASAIITDEGGITCHAAIVSRELGIPCVIGTKVATRVFKDGDIVEVDAEKGAITKLSNGQLTKDKKSVIIKR